MNFSLKPITIALFLAKESPMKAALPVLILLALTACTQSSARPGTEQPRPVLATQIKVDKSSPRSMYINTNNVRIYDLTPALLEQGVTTNTPYLEQFMKYDKVTLYTIRGDWAYVEGSARDTKTSQVRTVGGWVPQSTVTEWIPEKFFAVQDNVFKKIAKPITLYDDSLEGQAVDQIAKGDTFRVLKGNGERFFVVSQKGKEGWIEAESVDTSQLVAKGFGWKEEKRTSKIKSKMFLDSKGRALEYDIDGYYSLITNKAEIVFIKKNRLEGMYLKQNEFEVKIEEKLNQKRTLGTSDTNINGISYEGRKIFLDDFFGFFCVIDVYMPKSYRSHPLSYYQSPNIHDFLKWADEIEEQDLNEIVVFTLYSRNSNLTKFATKKIIGKIPMLYNLNRWDGLNKQYKIQGDKIVLSFEYYQNGLHLDPVKSLPDLSGEDEELQKKVLKYSLTKQIQEIELDMNKFNQDLIYKQLETWKQKMENEKKMQSYSSNSMIGDPVKPPLYRDLLSILSINGNQYKFDKDFWIDDFNAIYNYDFGTYMIPIFIPNDIENSKQGGFIIINSLGKVICTYLVPNSSNTELEVIHKDTIVLFQRNYDKTRSIIDIKGVTYEY